jgi:hypothetical protein
MTKSQAQFLLTGQIDAIMVRAITGKFLSTMREHQVLHQHHNIHNPMPENSIRNQVKSYIQSWVHNDDPELMHAAMLQVNEYMIGVYRELEWAANMPPQEKCRKTTEIELRRVKVWDTIPDYLREMIHDEFGFPAGVPDWMRSIGLDPIKVSYKTDKWTYLTFKRTPIRYYRSIRTSERTLHLRYINGEYESHGWDATSALDKGKECYKIIGGEALRYRRPELKPMKRSSF